MEKLIHSDDAQDGLIAAAGGALAFLFENTTQVKSASSSAMSEALMQQHLPDDKHFGVHLIAMGSGENYAHNRNGDHWPEDELKDRHHTFVKNGHFFREHRNRDPKLAIGSVKASAYNEDMDRVELIIHGDKEKAAPEYARFRDNKSSSYSMSARVVGDICSCCSHFAKKSAEYCQHAKRHMNQWLPEFSKFAFVRNVKPTFFDISDVGYPADRIAHHLEYLHGKGELEKAASAEFHGSAWLAEQQGLVLPSEQITGCASPVRQAWLEKLASLETRVEQLQRQPDGSPLSHFLKYAIQHTGSECPITAEEFQRLRNTDHQVLFNKLANRGAVLPFQWFAALALNEPLEKIASHPTTQAAAAHLPRVFRQLRDQDHDAELETSFLPATDYKSSCWNGDPIDGLLDQITPHYSIHPEQARVRIMRITIVPGIKCASGSPDVTARGKQLADAYGCYKLGFVEHAARELTPDYVDEPAQVLLLSEHIKSSVP